MLGMNCLVFSLLIWCWSSIPIKLCSLSRPRPFNDKMQLTPIFMALLSLLPFFASATPVPMSGTAALPDGTTMLGFDDLASGRAVAYDSKGTALGNVTLSNLPHRRDITGACAPLDATEMQKIPGWGTLAAQAQSNWGSGAATISTNPQAWADHGAIVCMNGRGSANPPKIVATGSPNCVDSSQATDGQFVNVAGTVSLTGNEGTLSTSTSTVTKESAIGGGVTVAAEVDFPLLAKFTTTVSLQTTFTNSLATATSSGTNTQQGRTFTINPTAGQTCHLEYQAESCTVSGTGTIPFVASGWAWWTYKSQVKGHWNWALLMEAYLTNEADRTSNMEIKVDMSSNTNSNYSAQCTGGSGSGATPAPAPSQSHK
ncbi:hypothetical protein FB451DRAFT_477212 [Mycena latifolia]|nr:hypothetical protein FB451DRAFT_477212 [Mycena latifolia]